MSDKLGPYINKLMTTIVDKEQEEFVHDLAFSELRRLKANIGEFLQKNELDDTEQVKQTVKQLLQEDKQDESN